MYVLSNSFNKELLTLIEDCVYQIFVFTRSYASEVKRNNVTYVNNQIKFTLKIYSSKSADLKKNKILPFKYVIIFHRKYCSCYN